MKKRGQISIEFLVLFAFVLAMFVPLVVVFYRQSAFIEDSLAANQVKKISDAIVDNAETVYYFGQPSKRTLKVVFPSRVNSVTIANREVIFNLSRKNAGPIEIYSTSLVNISGTISSHSGIHYIVLKSSGDYVSVQEG